MQELLNQAAQDDLAVDCSEWRCANGCQTPQTVTGWVPTDSRYYTPLPPAPIYVPAPQRFTNETDFPINDSTTIESPIAVTGVPGNAPATLRVEVNIAHTLISVTLS